jgi:hypothetical protein
MVRLAAKQLRVPSPRFTTSGPNSVTRELHGYQHYLVVCSTGALGHLHRQETDVELSPVAGREHPKVCVL